MKIKLLIALVFIQTVLYVLMVCPASEKPDITGFLVLSQLIFIVYLFILYIARKIKLSFDRHKYLFLSFLLVAVFLRIFVSYSSINQTYLSDDVFRYVWEGKLVSHTYNPFLYSPEDFEGSGLTDSLIYPHINHPSLPTIYPPLSLYLFAGAHLLGGDSIIGFKLLSLLFELLSLLFMYFLIRKFRLPDWTFLIYLFAPLIIIEFIFSNHLDILGFPFFILMLYFLKGPRPKPIGVGILLACGILIKLYLLFFLPFIFFHFKGKQKLTFALSVFLTVILFYLPFIASGGLHITGSLWKYLATWQYNGSLFLLLKQLFSQETARLICWISFLIGGTSLFFWRQTKDNLYRQLFAIFALYLILSPAIFNWYLLWIFPFIIIFQNKSFLLLSGTIVLSYHVLIGYYDNGVWTDYPLLRLAVYGPFYAMLIYELIVSFRNRNIQHL